MRGTFRELDFLIALALLCASSAVAAFAYATIQDREAPSNILVSDIRTGTRTMRILLGDRCPGDLTTTVIHDSVWVIQSSGTFRSSYGKSIIDLRYQAEARFNPLGQLQDAQLALTTDAANLSVKLFKANPINVQIERVIQGRISTQQVSFPGPILITKRGSSQTFAISAPFSPMAQNPSIKALQGLLSHELKFSLVPADDAPVSCDTVEHQRFDLLPLSMHLQSFLPVIFNLSASASTGSAR